MSTAFLDPQPFRDWYSGQKEHHEAEEIARWFGVDSRTLRRWDDGERIRRGEFEDAVIRSHFSLWDIYPDLEDEVIQMDDQREKRRHANALLSDDQLRILNAIHLKREVSIRALGREIWQQIGFASPESAETVIRRGFHRLHLPVEKRCARFASKRPRCKGTVRRTERQCELPALPGEELCWSHHPDRRPQRLANPQLFRKARETSYPTEEAA